MVESRYADQVEHFDAVHHQYSHEAILRPPLHTAIELERVFHSLRDVELDEYLPQLHALLRDGGKAVFSEPGALNPSWYALFLLRRAMQVERRIVHCNLVTLRKAFERHGFRDVRFTGVGLLPRPFFGWGETACRLHDQGGNLPLLRWFAYRYLIEATK
jgi:hypothetical protein